MKNFDKLKMREVSSIIPSLAKSKYNNPNVVTLLTNQLTLSLKNDLDLLNPHYIKKVIERLM